LSFDIKEVLEQLSPCCPTGQRIGRFKRGTDRNSDKPKKRQRREDRLGLDLGLV